MMMSVRNGLDLSSEQIEEITSCLTEMRRETRATSVLLADITGYLIVEQGIGSQLNTAALSALAAGELAATKEMARLVGERPRFKLLLHEGEQQSVYLSDVCGEMILVTVFDNTIPIGMIRLWTRNVVERLTEIIQRSMPEGAQRSLDVDAGFGRLIADQLDLILGDD